MDNCIKILIADADEGFTSDLACYLKTASSFDVVGAANDGERAVRLLRAAQPNVLILDLLLAEAGRAVRSEGSKRASQAAHRSCPDQRNDRLCGAGGGKIRRAVFSQQTM